MIPYFSYLEPFLRNYLRYSLQGFKMYYLELFLRLKLSAPITVEVSLLVRYIGNLGKFYFCAV